MPHVNRRRPRPPGGAPYSTANPRGARGRTGEPTGADEPAPRRSRRLAGSSAEEDTVVSPSHDAPRSLTLPRLPTASPSGSYTSSMRSTASPDWHAARTPLQSGDDEAHRFGLQTVSMAQMATPDAVSEPLAFALMFLLARSEERLQMASDYVREHSVDRDPTTAMPARFERSDSAQDGEVEEGMRFLGVLPEALTPLALFDFGSSPPPYPRSAEARRIDKALQDTAKWYSGLPSIKTVRITPAQALEHQCPISFVPFVEMSHPVSIRSGHVQHVFEAEALLTWMQASVTGDTEGAYATNPLDRSPLHLEMLGRVALTTDRPTNT